MKRFSLILSTGLLMLTASLHAQTPAPASTATPLVVSKAGCALLAPTVCIPHVALMIEQWAPGAYWVTVDVQMTDGSTQSLRKLVFVVDGIGSAGWEFSGADPSQDPFSVYGTVVTPVSQSQFATTDSHEPPSHK